nr:hypothetical protein [Streptomyces sp. A0958]
MTIPGTGDPAHLEADVAAGAPRLTDDEMLRPTALGQPGGRAVA